MNYILRCFNEKDKEIYRIKVLMSEKKFEKQIKRGYLKFYDEKYHTQVICYLNMYNKVIIER